MGWKDEGEKESEGEEEGETLLIYTEALLNTRKGINKEDDLDK